MQVSFRESAFVQTETGLVLHTKDLMCYHSLRGYGSIKVSKNFSLFFVHLLYVDVLFLKNYLSLCTQTLEYLFILTEDNISRNRTFDKKIPDLKYFSILSTDMRVFLSYCDGKLCIIYFLC